MTEDGQAEGTFLGVYGVMSDLDAGTLLAEDTEARAQITALKEEVASLLEMVVAESKRLDEKVLHVASTLMVIHGNVTSRIARAEQMLGIVIPE